jgi:GT2 family glycosyltransferase/glycosyltransferase involved in cell wall biosynthesis
MVTVSHRARTTLSETVAILILNRNQAAYTRDCLTSLAQIDYPSFRILVVDNGSEDDSLRQVAKDFGNVEFLWLRENLGVAGGRNAGLRQVLVSGPAYVLFLDNDTLVAPDFLTRLVARMNTDPEIGAVQPKIYFADPPTRICSVGGKLNPRISHYRHPRSGGDDSPQFSSREIDVVSGCAGLMRARVFDTIGLLDETYSPYCHEDVDWSVRIRNAGYRLVVEPAGMVWHRISTQPRASTEKLGYLAKGHVLFLRFHTRWFDLPASIAWVCIHISRRYLFPAVARGGWKSAAAVFAGIWAGVRQKRRPIEWLPTNAGSGRPEEESTASSLLPERKIFLVGVLGPFDSGPTRVYETLLKSHFVDHFQVRFLDLQFARNVADFERVRPQKFLRLLWYLLQTTYWLAKERHDALCIHLSTNRNAFLKDSLFAWLGFLFGVPVVVLEHGTNVPALYQRSGRVVQWFMTATLKRVARCIVLAECLKFNFVPFLPSERIVSAYLGIDSTPGSRALTESADTSDQVTVLYLSTLLESKGILVLLSALPKILSKCNNVRVIVAGGLGWDSTRVKASVDRFLRQENYADTVSFIGSVQGNEKLRVLQTADVFVLPTLVDTAPLVLLEAMRAGQPIVATNVGAIPEIVSDGVNALMCEKGNAEDLAEKIVYLVERPTLRQQMSEESLKRFENLFTAEKFAGRMIDVFESVFAETTRGTSVEAIET